MPENELEKQLFIAVSKNKPAIAKKLLEAGVVLREMWSLDDLVQKSKSLNFIKYLETKGIDFNQRNYVLLFKACMGFNTENVEYLLAKVPPEDESKIVPLCFSNLVGKSNGKYEDMAATAQLLYKRMTSEQISYVIQKINENKIFIPRATKEMMIINIQAGYMDAVLPTTSAPVARPKI